MKALFRWAFPAIVTIKKRPMHSTSFRTIREIFLANIQLFFQLAVTFFIFLVSRGKETKKVLTIKI
jgi:hypothetical protein